MLPQTLIHWHVSPYILLVWSNDAFAHVVTMQKQIQVEQDTWAVLLFTSCLKPPTKLCKSVYGNGMPVLLYNMQQCNASLTHVVSNVKANHVYIYSLNQPLNVTLANGNMPSNFVHVGRNDIHLLKGLANDEVLTDLLDKTCVVNMDELNIVYPQNYDMDLDGVFEDW